MSEELSKLIEIEREAEAIVERARGEAEKILADARRKAEEMIREGEAASFPELEEKYKRMIDEEVRKIEEEYSRMAEEVYSKGMENLDKAIEFVVRRVVE